MELAGVSGEKPKNADVAFGCSDRAGVCGRFALSAARIGFGENKTGSDEVVPCDEAR